MPHVDTIQSPEVLQTCYSMTGDNKICPSCPIEHGTPDRWYFHRIPIDAFDTDTLTSSPESDNLSNSAPRALNGLAVSRITENSPQSAGSSYDAPGAKGESQGLVASLREDAPWSVQYQKTEETLEDGFWEEMERVDIGRFQQFDSVSDHFGPVETSGSSVAASMNVDWEIDIHVNLRDTSYERGEENALSAAEIVSRKDYYLIGFGTQFET